MNRLGCNLVCSLLVVASFGCSSALTINQIQFVGSHNSYKMAMSPAHFEALQAQNPAAAEALAYSHVALEEQLDLGVRKLELDVFFAPQVGQFKVGHVQVIDMNSHCASLRICLTQLKRWSDANENHIPIWVSFNAKDQKISGLPDPVPFTSEAFSEMDDIIEDILGGRLIRPQDIQGLRWPTLRSARGKFLLILDEQGDKRELYWQSWQSRPMFTNAPVGHPAAAVMVVNDPIVEQTNIRELVRAGYMVRTRADADTREARTGDVVRRDAAFSSGAQAVSTDYYLPADHFGTGYQVKLADGVRCNPVTTQVRCVVTEK